VLFVGWFGPRGLASPVFALLALEGLGPSADGAVSIIGVTVLLSALVHGLTTRPLSSRCARGIPSPGRRPTTGPA
jgi:NhaP-type Na+/H+ or K+/H+ antiporter